MSIKQALALALIVHAAASTAAPADTTALPGQLFPLAAVRLLAGPFADAVKVNRAYLLAHDPDRLLAPFLREAGLETKSRRYGSWESSGLDGHTAGHYLSALATMIASGADAPEGELRRRLDYLIAELEHCQKASGDGYIGGVPGSRELWKAVASGHVEAVNPGRYGEFICAQAANGLYINLFIASEISATNLGLMLRQETRFPDEPRTRLTLRLEKPATFTLHLRHPVWVATPDFGVRVNGELVKTASTPSSYVTLGREWRDGDCVEIELPMRTTVERLPDGSDWVALLRGRGSGRKFKKCCGP